MITIQKMIDDGKCYEVIRELRWPQGICCPHCNFHWYKKRGFHTKQTGRQRYQCHSCEKCFDDLTATIFEGHHQPLKVWVLCLYFMGLNLSNMQISQELGLNKDDVQSMTTELRKFMHERRQPAQLEGEVECDEVYIVAGHKGHPSAVQAVEREGRRRRLKGQRGRGTLEGEKPPVFGMIQRTGQLVIQMLPNVQQTTIQPLIQQAISTGTTVYTDEYNIYARLTEWDYSHLTVNHS